MDVIMEVRTPSLMDLLELSSHERIILSLANPELEPRVRSADASSVLNPSLVGMSDIGKMLICV